LLFLYIIQSNNLS